MTDNMEIPLDWFVCPETKRALAIEGSALVSERGKYFKKGNPGFWNFIPSKLELFDEVNWNTWNILQENATVPYKDFPERNLGVGKRADYIAFSEFCNYKGIILDIGCGPQKIPTHLEYASNSKSFKFIGIDPLEGENPKRYPFVQALGEYIPFRDSLFDQVLYVTSLDHFIDPRVTLKEAKRVLKSNGEILVWLGEKDKNTPKPAESPDWYKKLVVPEGAEDPFHFKRFSSEEFECYLKEVGLSVAEKKVIEVDEWRKNIFYRIKK